VPAPSAVPVATRWLIAGIVVCAIIWGTTW